MRGEGRVQLPQRGTDEECRGEAMCCSVSGHENRELLIREGFRGRDLGKEGVHIAPQLHAELYPTTMAVNAPPGQSPSPPSLPHPRENARRSDLLSQR